MKIDMSMTFCIIPLYCHMKIIQRFLAGFNPTMNMMTAIAISFGTGILAFYETELDRETLVTFFAYYFILISMTIMFMLRNKLVNPKTRQMLQFSFFLLGFVLMVTGMLGLLRGNFNMAVVFLLMLFLPGLATLRAGLSFNKTGE